MSAFVSALAGLVLAGPGQFGFAHSHTLAYCDVSPNSFSVGTMRIAIGPERTGFVVANLSRHQKSLTMRPEPFAPIKIVYETSAAGFSMEYRNGAKFDVKGAPAPFISWSEGTVGPGIPSAPSRWALLSWGEARPPILLCFDGGEATVTATEADGGFVLDIPKFKGMLRVRFPFGREALKASTARELGALVKRVMSELPLLSRPGPRIVDFQLVESERGLLGTWFFDNTGALLPDGLVAGLKAGCVKLLSPKRQMLGNAFVSTSKEISVLFLGRRLQPGQSFVRGSTISGTLATNAESASVGRAAIDYLCGNWSLAADTALVDAHSTFASELEFSREPFSGALMPFAPDGGGTALAAANALASSALDESATWLNGLLASLDWVTWQPAGKTDEERRDASAFLALACAFRSEPEARLIGAMANCGALVGGEGPLSEVRKFIYPGPSAMAGDWIGALTSPVRLISKRMALADAPGVGFAISGVADSIRGIEVAIQSDQALKIVDMTGIDQAVIISSERPTVLRIKPVAAGPWTIRLARRSPGLPIPKAAPSPRYSADQH